MGIIYWQDEAEAACTANNMQAVALNAGLWAAYASCGQKGRAVFQQCALDSFEWSLDTVLAYAAYVDPPVHTATAPAPIAPMATAPIPVAAVAAAPATFIRARGKDEDTNEGKFITWMRDVAAATNQDRSLAYQCGARRVLVGDGTVAVSVAVRRNAAFLQGVSFVFHYHPGAKGASVGGAEGSKWHFKPFDGAKKWVRVADHGFGHLDAAMVKRVKEIARGR
jgi:hypothetical protein